jgi:hypothetical protein
MSLTLGLAVVGNAGAPATTTTHGVEVVFDDGLTSDEQEELRCDLAAGLARVQSCAQSDRVSGCGVVGGRSDDGSRETRQVLRLAASLKAIVRRLSL